MRPCRVSFGVSHCFCPVNASEDIMIPTAPADLSKRLYMTTPRRPRNESYPTVQSRVASSPTQRTTACFVPLPGPRTPTCPPVKPLNSSTFHHKTEVDSVTMLRKMIGELENITDGRHSFDDEESPFFALRQLLEGKTSREFWYCSMPDSDVYNLRLLSSQPKCGKYAILSCNGVSHVDNGVVEFTPLRDWLREYLTFRRVKTIPFFSLFEKIRKFSQWRRATVQHKRVAASNRLAETLFFLSDAIRPHLLSVRENLLRIEWDPCFLMFQSEDGVLSFETFRARHAAHVQRRLKRLHAHCTTVLQAIDSGRKRFVSVTNDNNDFSQQIHSRWEEKRKHSFVKVCHCMLRRSITVLGVKSINAFAHYVRCCNGVFQARLTFVDGCLSFEPSRQAFADMTDAVYNNIINAVCDDQLVLEGGVESLLVRDLLLSEKEATTSLQSVRDAVSTCYEKCMMHVTSFSRWETALGSLKTITPHNIRLQDPPASWFRATVVSVKQHLVDVDLIARQTQVSMFAVDNTAIAAAVRPLARECLLSLNTVLPAIAAEKNALFLVKVRRAIGAMEQLPVSIEAVGPYLAFCAALDLSEFENEVACIQELYTLIASDKSVRVPPEDWATLNTVTLPSMATFRELHSDFAETKERLLSEFGKQIVFELGELQRSAGMQLEKLKSSSLLLDGGLATQNLKESQAVLATAASFVRQERRMIEYQNEFALAPTPIEEVKHFFHFAETLELLWRGVVEWEDREASLMQSSWSQLSLEKMVSALSAASRTLSQCASLGNCGALSAFRQKVAFHKAHERLVEALQNRHLQVHHWRRFDELLKPHLGMTLSERRDSPWRSLVESGVLSVSTEVVAIAAAATQEAELEKELLALNALWLGGAKSRGMELSTIGFKDQRDMWIIGDNIDDVQSSISESQMSISSILASRYCDGSLKQRTEKLAASLRVVESTIEVWLSFQKLWANLEGVFSVNEIVRQWPDDEKLFKECDAFYRSLMKQYGSGCPVFHAASNAKLLASFEHHCGLLEVVRASLDRKLNAKRQVFPRLYFLSDADLMDLLAMARHPERTDSHVCKLFDGVSRVQVTSLGDATGAVGHLGEVLPFAKGFRARGDVEKWMVQFERSLFDFVRTSCMQSLLSYGAPRFVEWATSHPLQCVTLTEHVAWTQKIHSAAVEVSVSKPGSQLKDIITNLQTKLLDVTRVLRGETTLRRHSTLTSIATHLIQLREATANLGHTTEFGDSREWFTTLRVTQTSADGVLAHLAGHTVAYGYEYLGTYQRLVFTPLISRIFVTTFCAMKLSLGGAPSGPAGTGKTESVKDLARILGKFCLVFNCSEGVLPSTMAKILSGVVQSGVWLCLDEFNRIRLDVLSVVSSQLFEIHSAQKVKAVQFTFQGNELRSAPCGIFVTMNPGYYGRTELPDNLKSLFRPVAVCRPDVAMIAESILVSEGFVDAVQLAPRLVCFFELCRETLAGSTQADFGMRALRATLQFAGTLLRTSSQTASEIESLVVACKSCNFSKLSADDERIAGFLLNDAFGFVETSEIREFLAYCRSQASALGLICIEAQCLRTEYLFHMLGSRSGVAVLGPAGCGKSTVKDITRTVISRDLATANQSLWRVVVEHRINPKSLCYAHLFGEFNSVTLQWRDGVLPHLMRLIHYDSVYAAGVQEQLKAESVAHWMTFDGPLDTHWAESLNTALDESRLFCVDNGERILVSSYVRFLFECEDLVGASPATVSRLGIVCVHSDDYPTAMALSAVERIASRFGSEKVGDWSSSQIVSCVLKFLAFSKQTCDMRVAVSELQLCTVFVEIFDAVSRSDVRELPCVQQAVAFALVWSMGCLGGPSFQETFDGFCRDQFDSTIGSFPVRGLVHDYCIHGNRWVRWEELLPPVAGVSSFVHSVDSFRLSWLYGLGCSRGMLISGRTGTGKSIISRHLMKGVNASQQSYVLVRLSTSSTVADVQAALEEGLQFRSQRDFSPVKVTSSSVAVCFVDDLHLAPVDDFTACPTMELLRQLLTERGFYDTARNALRCAVDTTRFVVTCDSDVAASRSLSHRFTRHFHVYEIADRVDVNAAALFSGCLRDFFDKGVDDCRFNADVRNVADRVLQATIDVFTTVRQLFRPSVLSPQYCYNMRDIERIIHGVLRAHPKVISDGAAMSGLWANECHRTLGDRLAAHERAEFAGIILEVAKRNHFSTSNCDGATLWCNNSRDHIYSPVFDADALTRFVAQHSLDLTVSQHVLEHLVRVGRCLQLPACDLLITGASGSGRKTIAMLACRVFEVTAVDGSMCATHGAFLEAMRLGTLASYAGQNTVMFVEDGEYLDERILSTTATFVNSGDVRECFSKDEYEVVVAKTAGATETHFKTPADVFRYFCEAARSHFRIIFSADPHSPQFGMRVRKFPSLVSCCAVDYVAVWPRSTLMLHATEALAGVSGSDLISACVEAHTAALGAFTNAGTHPTSVSFVLFVQLVKRVYGFYEQLLSRRLNQLLLGAEKMQETKGQVVQMEREVKEMEPQLEQKAGDVAALVQHAAEQAAHAQAISKEVAEQQIVAEREEQFANAIRLDAARELEAALPEYDRAVDALKSLQKSDIDEIKKYSVPTRAVSQTIEAVLTVLGERKAGDWSVAKQVLSGGRFLERLAVLRISDLTEDIVCRVERFVKDPDFTPDKVGVAGSEACRSLCLWVHAVRNYYRVNCSVEPKRQRLAAAEADALQAQQTLTATTLQLMEAQKSLQQLTEQLRDAQNELKRLEFAVATARKRLSVADALQSSLASESERWLSVAELERRSIKRLPAHSLLLAAVSVYGSQHTAADRRRLVQTFTATASSLCPEGASSFDPSQFVDSVDLRQWTIEGLPSDENSRQNAVCCDVVLRHAARWPLFVDPQEQGLAWVVRTSLFKGCTVVDAGEQNLLAIVKRNVSVGVPTVIVNTPHAMLDPGLRDLLQRNLRGTAEGARVVRIGTEDVVYNEMFQLALVTKSAAPVSPQMLALSVVVNFSVEPAGIEEQVLSGVVSLRLLDVQRASDKNLRELSATAKLLEETQSSILRLLSESSGNILDNETLVSQLRRAQNSAVDLEKTKFDSEQQRQVLESQRSVVSPLAAAIRMAYFEAAKAKAMNSLLDVSLAAVIELALAEAERTRELDVTASAISVVKTVHKRLRAGVPAADKTLFDLHFCCGMLVWRGETSSAVVEAVIGANVSEPQSVLRWLDSQWGTHFSSTRYIAEAFASSESISALDADLIPLTCVQRLALTRLMRPDLFAEAVRLTCADVFGPSEVAHDIIIQDTQSDRPILIITQQGTDPTFWLLGVAKRLKCPLTVVPLGHGQEKTALAALHDHIEKSAWVLFQNCQLLPQVLEAADRLLRTGPSAKEFRLFLSCQNRVDLPRQLVPRWAKLAFDAPVGIRDSFMRKDEREKQMNSSLMRLHCAVIARGRFGRQGWSTPYEFSFVDFAAAAEWFVDEGVPPHLKAVAVDAIYGGRVSEPFDRRVLQELFHLHFIYSDESSFDQNATDHELCGMDWAAVQRQMHLESYAIANSARQIQLSIRSNQKRISAPLHTTLDSLPPVISWDSLHPLHSSAEPFSVALRCELRWYARAIDILRLSLETCIAAEGGHAVSSQETDDVREALVVGVLPRCWSSLGVEAAHAVLLVKHLHSAYDTLRRWSLQPDPPSPLPLATLRFPRGPLTALMQRAVRKAPEFLPLWNLRTMLSTNLPPNDVVDSLRCSGVFADGFLWDTAAQCMTPIARGSPHSPLTSQLHLTVIRDAESVSVEHYACPLFRSSSRNEHITDVYLGTGALSAEQWTLRGVAVLLHSDLP